MACKKIYLPSRQFESKKEATQFFKKMLHHYGDGETINNYDSKILFELLQRHPDAKLGEGVNRFYRDLSPDHPTSCFHLERTNGTKTDFSYKTCIDGFPTPLDRQFYQACRQAVSEDLIRQKVEAFRKAGGIMQCIKTGALLRIEDADYRHIQPKFMDIVTEFIKRYNIQVVSSIVLQSTDLNYSCKLIDSKLEESFKKFHSSKARFAIFRKFSR